MAQTELEHLKSRLEARERLIEVLIDDYAASLAERTAMRMLLSRTADIGAAELASSWERRTRNLTKMSAMREVVAERVASLRRAIESRLAADDLRDLLARLPDLPVF